MPPSSYNENPQWHSQPQASYPVYGIPQQPQQPQENYPVYGVPQQPQQPQASYPAGTPFPQNPAQLYPGPNNYQQPGYAAPGMYQPASPYMVQQPMYQPAMVQQPFAYGVDPYSGKALAGLILGIIGLTVWLIPFVGSPSAIVCAIIGIVLSAQGRNSPTRGGMATAGLVLSIIAVAFVPLLLLCSGGMAIFI